MKQIDVLNWHEFVIRDLFKIKRPEARSQMDYDEGEVPFVASGNFNNGVLKYLKPKNDKDIDLGNCITVSPIDGSSFYQECNFLGRGGAGSSIILLYNPKLNRYNGNFIATVIRSVCKKYMYSDMANKDVIGLEKIKLPVYSSGEPNWEYMEQYMKNIEFQVRMSIDKLSNVIGGSKKHLNICKWGTFMVGELFEIYKPKVYHTYEVKENPNGIPYVVRSKFDNGIKYRVSRNSNIATSPNGVISFGSENATFFYQGEEWCSGRDIYYIDTRGIPKESCLFIIACLQTIVGKYSYSNGLFPDLLRRETIKLPIDDYGKPDWNYMKSSIISIKERISSSPILL